MQDYEQCHKNIKDAKYSTIKKLSLAIGCTVEDIVDDIEYFEDKCVFKSDEYGVYGRVIEKDGELGIHSIYDGKEILQKLEMKKKEEIFEAQKMMASLFLDEYIAQYEFEKFFKDKLKIK